MCVCVCVFHSFLYRLLFCNDLKNQKKSCFLSFSFLIPFCLCVCVFGALDFVCFLLSLSRLSFLLLRLPEINNILLSEFLFIFFFFFLFVFGFNRSTLLDSHTRKQNFVVSRCVLFLFFFFFVFLFCFGETRGNISSSCSMCFRLTKSKFSVCVFVELTDLSVSEGNFFFLSFCSLSFFFLFLSFVCVQMKQKKEEEKKTK